MVSIGGPTLGDTHQFRVYENPGNSNDWITVKLVSVKLNRAGIGARIHVVVEMKERSVYRTVGTGGSFGANHFQKRIGLGKSAKIVQLKVRWRASNSRQNFSNVEKRQFIEIKEFAKNWTTLARKPFRLGPVNHQQRLCPFTGAGFALEWRELGRRHGSRTMRQGRIAANLEGNEYTAKQLGDLTEAVMAR